MAIIEHDFGNGLTVRNGSFYADYNRGYQNVYPGGTGALAPGGGAVTPDQTQLTLNAYQNYTPRENAFNQTDFIYKTVTGPVRTPSRSVPSSAARPACRCAIPASFRTTANSPFDVVNPFNPTYFGPVAFIHHRDPTPTASTGSTSRRAMRRTRSN